MLTSFIASVLSSLVTLWFRDHSLASSAKRQQPVVISGEDYFIVPRREYVELKKKQFGLEGTE